MQYAVCSMRYAVCGMQYAELLNKLSEISYSIALLYRTHSEHFKTEIYRTVHKGTVRTAQ